MGLSIFKAQRLIRLYENLVKSQTNTGLEALSAVPKTLQRKPDKSYGWIIYPKTKMNYFYNQVCKSLFGEMNPSLSGPKSQFKKMFHAEARRGYIIEKRWNMRSKKLSICNHREIPVKLVSYCKTKECQSSMTLIQYS